MRGAIRMKKGYLLSVFLLCISIVLAASSVQAFSFSESTAIFDISSLTITPSPGVTVDTYPDEWNWGGQVQVSNNLGESEGPIFGGNPTASVTGAFAEALTPAVAPELSGHALVDVSEPGLQAKAGVLNELFVGTYYDRPYYFYGTGTITITIDYLLELEMTTDIPGDWAEGYAEAELRVLYNNEGVLGGVLDDITFTTSDILPGSVADGSDFSKQTISGTLSFLIDVDTDLGVSGVGFLQIDGLVANSAEAFAAIPEPATMLLLGAGLVGLSGFMRRRRQSRLY